MENRKNTALKLKLNKQPKTVARKKPKVSKPVVVVETDDDSNDSTFGLDLDKKAKDSGGGPEKTADAADETLQLLDVAVPSEKDLADVAGVLILRGGFNRGFGLVAKTLEEPMRVIISGDTVPGPRDDSSEFKLRLGNERAKLRGQAARDTQGHTDTKKQMYDEEEIARATQPPENAEAK